MVSPRLPLMFLGNMLPGVPCNNVAMCMVAFRTTCLHEPFSYHNLAMASKKEILMWLFKLKKKNPVTEQFSIAEASVLTGESRKIRYNLLLERDSQVQVKLLDMEEQLASWITELSSRNCTCMLLELLFKGKLLNSTMGRKISLLVEDGHLIFSNIMIFN